MQPVSGFELIQKLVGIRPNIPVIVHSSDVITPYPNSPIRKVVQKPASLQDLAGAVRSVLDAAVTTVSQQWEYRQEKTCTSCPNMDDHF